MSWLFSRTYLGVQRVSAELHGAGDDGLCGDRVQDPAVLEDDEAGHVRDDVPLLKLLQIEDLDVRQPQAVHEVRRAHDSLGAPISAAFVDNQAGFLPRQVEVQLEGHGQRDVVDAARLIWDETRSFA